MEREEAVTAALQLQHDAGLIMSNHQVLGQFITSLNRMSSEVMRLAFGQEVFPSVAVQAISSGSPCGSLHGSDGIMVPAGWPGCSWPVPVSSCNNCMKCMACFPTLNA